jgi:5-methylcytosine-specific restriction enzyme B
MSLPLFSPAAFDLLNEFSRDPTAAFYQAHRADLQVLIQQPFHRLMEGAAARLPHAMTDRLETRHNLYSRFLKNDFGQGGAWDHYWAAFYPKGERRTYDVQLAVWMESSLVQVSFYVSDYAAQRRARLIRSCARWYWELLALLPDLFEGHNLVLASDWETCLDAEGKIAAAHPLSWGDWLKDPARGLFCLRVPYTRAEAETMPLEDWVERAVQIHSAYFPLALCCVEEEPMLALRFFLEQIGQ